MINVLQEMITSDLKYGTRETVIIGGSSAVASAEFFPSELRTRLKYIYRL
jgi:hypothetical protein